jgi:hypothetical protein
MSQLLAIIIAAAIALGSTTWVYANGKWDKYKDSSKHQYGCDPAHYGPHCSQNTHSFPSHWCWRGSKAGWQWHHHGHYNH